MCGPAIAEVIAAQLNISPHQVGRLNIRPPLKPVPLSEVAAMELDTGIKESVNWLLDKKKNGKSGA
jgi:hypothetical protein